MKRRREETDDGQIREGGNRSQRSNDDRKELYVGGSGVEKRRKGWEKVGKWKHNSCGEKKLRQGKGKGDDEG